MMKLKKLKYIISIIFISILFGSFFIFNFNQKEPNKIDDNALKTNINTYDYDQEESSYQITATNMYKTLQEDGTYPWTFDLNIFTSLKSDVKYAYDLTLYQSDEWVQEDSIEVGDSRVMSTNTPFDMVYLGEDENNSSYSQYLLTTRITDYDSFIQTGSYFQGKIVLYEMDENGNIIEDTATNPIYTKYIQYPNPGTNIIRPELIEEPTYVEDDEEDSFSFEIDVKSGGGESLNDDNESYGVFNPDTEFKVLNWNEEKGYYEKISYSLTNKILSQSNSDVKIKYTISGLDPNQTYKVSDLRFIFIDEPISPNDTFPEYIKPDGEVQLSDNEIVSGPSAIAGTLTPTSVQFTVTIKSGGDYNEFNPSEDFRVYEDATKTTEFPLNIIDQNQSDDELTIIYQIYDLTPDLKYDFYYSMNDKIEGYFANDTLTPKLWDNEVSSEPTIDTESTTPTSVQFTVTIKSGIDYNEFNPSEDFKVYEDAEKTTEFPLTIIDQNQLDDELTIIYQIDDLSPNVTYNLYYSINDKDAVAFNDSITTLKLDNEVSSEPTIDTESTTTTKCPIYQ
ncbi:MAG: hypothetical protein TYPL_5090 [Candidatus Tyloplasma litorale]|nr:MAG: hypothetical protein TYPL_5090 [Mycoplasmatales bacterium]